MIRDLLNRVRTQCDQMDEQLLARIAKYKQDGFLVSKVRVLATMRA